MGAVEIAHSLAASRRAVRLYPPEHPAHREAVSDLVAAVNEAIDVRPLALNLHKGRLYEGSDVITDTTSAVRALIGAMEARHIESLTFHVGFADVDGVGVSEVLSLRPSPDLEIQAELDARDVRCVTAAELEDESAGDAEERDRRRESDRALFRRALSAFRDLTAGLEGDGDIDAGAAPRAVAPFVGRVAEDPGALLSIATTAGHGDRMLFHAVAVMLRSLVVGHALGLSDEELLALGLAGLLHDVGLPVAAARGAEPDTAREVHPVVGAQALGAVADEDCAVMVVAFEHHMGVDGAGWPAPVVDGALHPYTRIVEVADLFDELTRPAEGAPLRPDQAAALVLKEGCEGSLDPILARLFAQLVGVFPLGAVVRLTDQSVGVVVDPSEDPLRPRVRVVLGPDGIELRPPVDVSLAEDDREIAEIVDAAVLGLQVSDYL